MDAANPLCRCFLFIVGLATILGCQSEKASQIARGQLPPSGVDPFAPLAPIAPPATPPYPLPAPAKTVAPAVPGSPVPPDAKGPPIVATGFTGAKNFATAAEMLKNGVPRVKVVAIVGANNVITDQEVLEAVWQQFHLLEGLNGYARTAKQKEMYTLALRKTIERELLLDEMYGKLKKANKMNVIDEIKEYATQTADRQLKLYRSKSKAQSEDEFAAMLRAQGLTLQVIRRQMERQMMADQYVSSMLKEKGRRVGLGEIRDYYDKHADEFKSPDRVKWQHLFVSFNRHANAQAAYNHAARLREAANGTDFAALSMQFDEGLAKQQGGAGSGEKRGEILPADIEPTVWDLKPGQISGVLQTPTGYHIVKVIEREYAGVQPFDTKVQTKIRDKLNDAIYETEYKKLVDELWRKGVVRVMEE